MRIRPLQQAVVAVVLALAATAGAVAQQRSAYDRTPAAQEQPSVYTAAAAPASAPSLGQPIVRQRNVSTATPAALPGQTRAPFQLNEAQQQYVMQLLHMWENESAKIKTFNTDFERLEYDAVWGPGAGRPIIQSRGRLSYSKPDRGSFKIEQIHRWKKEDPQDARNDAPGSFVLQNDEVGEHWVCDGKAIYEYNHKKKQLVVTSIPEQMRGKSIVDGPLPFLFGAEADKLARRYWIRTKQANPPNQAIIWLEAHPRWQSDAANYHHVEIMLERKTMQPTALQVHMPGGQQRHVYTFANPTVNGKLDGIFGNLFNAPRTPLGWTRVVNDDVGPQATNPAAPRVQK